MAEKEKEKEDNGLLLLLGGLSLYLLTRDKGKEDTANSKNGGGATDGGSGNTTITLNIPQQPTQQQPIQYTQRDLSSEETYILQRLLEEEKKKNEELEKQLRQEYEQQKEIEDVKQEIKDSGIMSEEEVEELDMREQGQELYPNQPTNFYDFYNFADADTALAIHSFTQINAINYLRFRLNYRDTKDVFKVNYVDERNGLVGVYFPSIKVEIANPLDSAVNILLVPYGAKINGCLFAPMSPVWHHKDFDSNELVQRFYSDEYMGLSIFEDTKVLEQYIMEVIGKTSFADYKNNLTQMLRLLASYQNNLDNSDIVVEPKSIVKTSYVLPLMISSDRNFFKNFDKDNFNAEIYIFAKDVANNTKRLLTLQMSSGDRPVVAELEKEYISPNQIDVKYKDREFYDNFHYYGMF